MARFLTTKESAELLNLRPSTLEAWRCRGGGPRYVRMGSAIRYRMEDLETFVEASLEQNTAGRGRD